MEAPGSAEAMGSVQSAVNMAMVRNAAHQNAGTVETLMESVEAVQETAVEVQGGSGKPEGVGDNIDFLA